MRGGRRPGAGRPKGAINKRTEALAEAVAVTAATLKDTIPDAFTGDAHALLMALYKDPANPLTLRMEAARAAIRYEKPALAALQVGGDENAPLEVSVTSDLERAKAVASLVAKFRGAG
jgi:hypothetical protein